MKQNNVIVLIPHYNCPQSLYNSIGSIREDENIDILVVDDGSNKLFVEDKCILAKKFNGTIFFEYLEENKGIEVAMNYGLEIIKRKNYPLIARLDCGDLVLKNRFKIQEDFLKSNSDIALLGSYANYVDMNGKFLFVLKNPCSNFGINKKIYLTSPIIHPSIMFRSEVLKIVKGYPTKYKYVEDHAFFFNLYNHNLKMANIDIPLIDYEVNPNGISLSKRNEQLRGRIRLIYANFYFGFYPIYGLLRNVLIYMTPYRIIFAVKKIIKGAKDK